MSRCHLAQLLRSGPRRLSVLAHLASCPRWVCSLEVDKLARSVDFATRCSAFLGPPSPSPGTSPPRANGTHLWWSKSGGGLLLKPSPCHVRRRLAEFRSPCWGLNPNECPASPNLRPLHNPRPRTVRKAIFYSATVTELCVDDPPLRHLDPIQALRQQ